MMKHLLLGLSALTLVGCGGAEAPMSVVAPEAGFYAEDMAEAKMMAPEPSRRGQQIEPTENAGAFLAYRYGYGIELPAATVKPTMDAHMQACQAAGPALCQVMGSNANAYSDSNVQAQLSLRAEPDWLDGFVAKMRTDIDAADGRLTSATTNVQDLTRSILDTDARLSAQKTLRTRLENLLQTRDAKLPDLLALERELARVQSEIESATANLKALRARVSMSTVDISYTSESVAVSRSAFAPIGNAIKGFTRTLSEGLSGVIYFFAAILPWLIFVILPALWVLRWFWRRRKAA